MITGYGDIARALAEVDHPGRVYFASGVSNSAETRVSEFGRERRLLDAQPRHLRLVYFSSLCVFYSDTPYANHKRSMEAAVKEWFPAWTIMRLGNITWGTNPNTLINTMRARDAANQPQVIADVYRYLVDAEELRHWMALIPAFNCEMNITGRRMKVADIYQELVVKERLMTWA